MSSPGGNERIGALSRRDFLKVAAATGTATAIPVSAVGAQLMGQLAAMASGAGPQPLNNGDGFFLKAVYTDPATKNVHNLYQIASAICSRIVPTSTNPITGKVSPGAYDAAAVNYIDIFMAAFQSDLLSSALVNGSALVKGNSPIYLNGRFSGRYNFGDSTYGTEMHGTVTDDFETSASSSGASGIRFLGLTDAEAVVWYLRIYGAPDPVKNPNSNPPWPSWSSAGWKAAVTSGLIPGATPLRSMYVAGLSAFDDWSNQNFGTPFDSATTQQQDALLFLAWNPILGAASQAGFPGFPPAMPNPVPPPAAAALFGPIVLHTIQGTYGLPEYRGQSDSIVNGTAAEPTVGTIWGDIGFDGDTQPLGNSIYKYDPVGSLNDGYATATYTDASGKQQPQGTYVQFRRVDSPDPSDLSTITSAQIAEIIAGLQSKGIIKVTNGGAL